MPPIDGTIRFTKMEGAGNDYIYINLFEETLFMAEELAVKMSHRHFGIGSDGLVFIAPSKSADVRMIMMNADGSTSQMCGNAIRCVGKYAFDYGLVESTSIKVETDAGIMDLQLHLDAFQKVDRVKVSMGIPALAGNKSSSRFESSNYIDHLFEFEDFSIRGTLVSMGNPHLVTYVDSVDNAPVTTWGPIIENDPRFSQRINIEFVEIINKHEVRQRTWERGSGETWACGTGASAVCVAGILTGKTDSKILNHLTGGDLNLEWPGENHPVLMEGPAREVFSGYWPIDPARD